MGPGHCSLIQKNTSLIPGEKESSVVGVAAAIWIPHSGNLSIFDRGDSAFDICDSQKRDLTYTKDRWPAWAFRVLCGLTCSWLDDGWDPPLRSAVTFFPPLPRHLQRTVNSMALNHSQPCDPRSHITSPSSPIWIYLRWCASNLRLYFFLDKVNLIFKFYFLTWSFVVYTKFWF